MKKRSLAAGFVVLATAALAASAVMATAQTTPTRTIPSDGAMNPFRTLKNMDVEKAPTRGDDRAACEIATKARARFEAGLSTAQERSRAFEHAKTLASSDVMRRAIDSGLIPNCPPDINRGAQS